MTFGRYSLQNFILTIVLTAALVITISSETTAQVELIVTVGDTTGDALRDSLPIDLKGIHKIIRVSVTLEDFATLQSNLSRFSETGWLPKGFIPCPTMNLSDFETLFDILRAKTKWRVRSLG